MMCKIWTQKRVVHKKQFAKKLSGKAFCNICKQWSETEICNICKKSDLDSCWNLQSVWKYCHTRWVALQEIRFLFSPMSCFSIFCQQCIWSLNSNFSSSSTSFPKFTLGTSVKNNNNSIGRRPQRAAAWGKHKPAGSMRYKPNHWKDVLRPTCVWQAEKVY